MVLNKVENVTASIFVTVVYGKYVFLYLNSKVLVTRAKAIVSEISLKF